jgi:hypothetical protein
MSEAAVNGDQGGKATPKNSIIAAIDCGVLSRFKSKLNGELVVQLV